MDYCISEKNNNDFVFSVPPVQKNYEENGDQNYTF